MRDTLALLPKLVEHGRAGYARKWSAFRLLRNVPARFAFIARVADPRVVRGLHRQRGGPQVAVDAAFRDLFALDPLLFTEEVKAQVHLPASKGGFGLAPTVDTLEVQYVSAALLVAPVVRALTGLPFLVRSRDHSTPSERSIWSSADQLAARGCAPPAWGDATEGGKAWSKAAREHLAVAREEQVFDGLDDDDAARMESCSGPSAGAWVHGRALVGSVDLEPELVTDPGAFRGPPPCLKAATGLRSCDADARRLVRLRLGMPTVAPRATCGRRAATPGIIPAACPIAPSSQLRASWHALSCQYGADIRRRHDRVASLLRLLILEIAGATVDWLPHSDEWRQDDGEPGEPDLLARVPGWEDMYIDVTVVAPKQGAPGQGASDAECTKERKYPAWRDRVKASVHEFQAAAWEHYGRAGQTTELLIARLATRCAHDRGFAPSGEVTRWRELLAACLMGEQAHILARHGHIGAAN